MNRILHAKLLLTIVGADAFVRPEERKRRVAQLVPVSEFCSLQTDAIARSARNPGRMRPGLHVPVVRFPLRTIPMNRILDAKLLTIFSAALALILSLPSDATAQTQIVWQGHTWNVTNGGMAGVARGNPSNVSVDSKGRLHLGIQKRDGAWTASELFTIDNLGFGTYQWVVEGNAWDMDPVTVLGLFPYGPVHKIGGDATNEIDIEFSKWNNTCVCNADFTVYPSESRQGKPSYELNFKVDTKTNLTTARMVWSSKSIVFTMMKGNQPIGTTAEVLKTETFNSSGATDIPQQPIPTGINLWAFKAVPATNQSLIIRSFQYVP